MLQLKILKRCSKHPNLEVCLVTPVDVPPELHQLDAELRRHGVEVRIQPPPKAGVYGLYQPSVKRLWVSPITKDLGIFVRTYLHEAVHAAQSCPKGSPTLLGVNTSLQPVVQLRINQLLYSRYSHGSSAIEREAFEIQGRPDAVPLIISSLRQRCSSVL